MNVRGYWWCGACRDRFPPEAFDRILKGATKPDGSDLCDVYRHKRCRLGIVNVPVVVQSPQT